MSPSNSKPKPPDPRRRILIIILLLVIGLSALPGYFKGIWSWSDLPPVTQIQQLRQLRKEGFTLPNWDIVDQRLDFEIGGNRWSRQRFKKNEQRPLVLMLRTQPDHDEYPQVEWADIDGRERWKSDSHRQITVKVNLAENDTIKVKARYFRAWRKRTLAVVQWYAFPEGGHFSPHHWFIRDQISQFFRRRTPWIAVCLQIPIQPLGDIDQTIPLAKSLVQEIQAQLINRTFNPQE